MTFRGSFSPSTEARPPMTNAAGNLIPNSSLEDSLTGIWSSLSLTNCSVERSTVNHHTGAHALKVTASASPGNLWTIGLDTSSLGLNGPCQVSCRYVPVGFSGAQMEISTVVLGSEFSDSASTAASDGVWNSVKGRYPDVVDAPDIVTAIRYRGACAASPRVYYLDTFTAFEFAPGTVTATKPLQPWTPYPSEAFYIAGDFWSCVGATASFDGVSYAAGDLITATGTANEFGFIYLDDVVWNKTEYVPSPDGPIATLLQQRPTDNVGFPV